MAVLLMLLFLVVLDLAAAVIASPAIVGKNFAPWPALAPAMPTCPFPSRLILPGCSALLPLLLLFVKTTFLHFEGCAFLLEAHLAEKESFLLLLQVLLPLPKVTP